MELKLFIICLKGYNKVLEDNMKKVVIILCVMIAIFSVVACSDTPAIDRGDGSDNLDVSTDTVTFSGTILELNGNNAIVEPFEGEPIRSSADKIVVDLSSNNENFAVGDEIIVEYTGEVMESYPAQIVVLGIEKVE